MKILQVKKFPIFDIFTGQGWLNWTRVLIQKNKVTTLKGTPLNNNTPTTTVIHTLATASRKHNQKTTNI